MSKQQKNQNDPKPAEGQTSPGTTQVAAPTTASLPFDPEKERDAKTDKVADAQQKLDEHERARRESEYRAEIADLQGQIDRKNEELAELRAKLEEAAKEIERQRVTLNKVRVGAINVPDGAAQLTDCVTFIEGLNNGRIDGKLGDVIVRDGQRDVVAALQRQYGKQHRVYAVAAAQYDEIIQINMAAPGA